MDAIQRIIGIALGDHANSDCLPGDAERNGQIAVDESVTAAIDTRNG
ncbi:MAG: hypothetical protein U0587_03920 [Candidatus Binatia bacterium]